MRALVCRQLGEDFSNVGLQDFDVPAVDAGQVGVCVEAASLNFPDLLMLKGGYQFKPDLPFVVGMDFAGAIVTGGGNWTDGQRVAGGGKTGAFAERLSCAADGLTVIPEGVAVEEAAAYPAAYLTAHVALINRGNLQPGETLLVHGASGGVGLAAVDVGRLLGARVIATTGDADKVAALKDAGADDVLVVGDGFRETVKSMTAGRGADVIFDPVGGDVFDESTRCINFGGRLLVVGFADGRIPTVKANIPLIKGFSVVGVRAGEFCRRNVAAGLKVREQIWSWLAHGQTRPRIHCVLPLDRWEEGFALMRDRRLVGKVVFKP